jgi:hypothetical protein
LLNRINSFGRKSLTNIVVTCEKEAIFFVCDVKKCIKKQNLESLCQQRFQPHRRINFVKIVRPKPAFMRKVLLRTVCLVSLIAVLFSAFSTPVRTSIPNFFPAKRDMKALNDATFNAQPRLQIVRNNPDKKVPQIDLVSSGCSTVTKIVHFSAKTPEQVVIPGNVIGDVFITAVGADGGNSLYAEDFGGTNFGGKGAFIQAKYSANTLSGKTLNIISGQQGGDEIMGSDALSAGGGGGTFVSLESTFSVESDLLIAAGGGGGGGFVGVIKITGTDINNDLNANLVYEGQRATRGNYGADGGGGGPYSLEAGHGGGAGNASGGGAGYKNGGGDGDGPYFMGGKAPSAGAAGGTAQSGTFGEYGGYGGGGASNSGGGGGGGYSGGAGGGDFGFGGGGGSYLNSGATLMDSHTGSTSDNLYGGDGYVRITYSLPKPIIAVYGNSTLIANNNAAYSVTDLTDYGIASVGSSTVHTFEIRNRGTAPLHISGITGQTTEFTVGSPVSTTVAASGATTFDVTFNPHSTGVKTTSITIQSDDACTLEYKVNVKGQGDNVAPPLTSGSIGSPQTICSGVAPAELTSGTAASGGTGSISYRWQSGTDNISFTDIPGAIHASYQPLALTATTYYRRVASTTADGDKFTGSVKITVNTTATPTISASGSTTICQGGSVTLTSSVADSYSWSNGATTRSTTISTAGSYTVTVTQNSCPATSVATTIVVNAVPSKPTVTVVDNCNNTSTLTASDYTGTLLWSTGATTPSISVSSEGTYTVTQTLSGCTSAAGSGIAAPKSPTVVTISAGGPIAFCAGGSVVLTSSSLSGNTWSNGETTESITVTAAGTYAVTAVVNGCPGTSANTVVTVNPVPAAPTGSGNSRCGTGDVTISAIPGAGETIDWYAGETGGLPVAVGSTTYTAIGHGTTTIYYAQARNITTGCVSATRTAVTVTINHPAPPTISSNAMPTTFCNGGSVLLTSSSAANNVWSTGETTPSITVSASGDYSVSVTTSGCEATSAPVTVTVKPTPSRPVVTVVDNCNGTSTLSTTATGTLLWSDNQTTSSITVSSAGTYSVTQSVNGCTSAAGSGVAAPKTTPSTPVVSVVDNCNGTSTLSTTATGTLLWNTNEATSSITVSSAGTYRVTQSVDGCISASGFGVAAPKTTPSAPVVTVVDNCNGTSTLSTTATGNLLWITNETTASITVSSAGTYRVTQSVDGCISAAGSGVAAPKTTPLRPVVTVVDNCNGTSTLSTNATGTLLWSTNETTSSITVSSAGTYGITQSVDGCISASGSGVAAPKTTPSRPVVTVVDNCNGTSTLSTTATGTLLWSDNQTTFSITVSSAGTYSVTQSVNGCTSAAGSGVAAPKTTPATPVVTVVDNCGTSTLSTNATGNLLWSNNQTTSSITVSSAGTYSVTATMNGCTSAAGSGVAAPKSTPVTPTVTVHNDCGISSLTASGYTGSLLWSTGSTGSVIVSFTPGTFTVTQTLNGCTSAAGSGTVVPNTPPPPPTVTVTNNCDGTSILTASNYTGTLIWSTGETTPSITVNTFGSRVVQQTIAGCNSAAASGFADPKTAPVAPTISVIDNCNGTSTLTASAYTGSLLWSTGATTSSITVNTAGTYTATQLFSGCTSAAGSGIASPKTTPSTPVVTVVDNCNGTSTLSTTATGTLLWSDNQTTSSITVSSAGTYSVTQSVNGCTSAAGSGVAAPKTTPATPVVTVVDNCGTSTLSTNATGNLLWSNNQTTSSITVSSAGTYSVTATMNGCTSAAGSGVAAPKSTPVAPTVTVHNDCGISSLTASGYTGSLLWSTGATGSVIVSFTPGTFTVTQTLNGCTSAAGSGTVVPNTPPPPPTVTVTNNCDGTSILTASNYTGTLIWSTGETTPSITVNTFGSRVVQQTIAGCNSAAASGFADPKTAPVAPTISVIDNCNGTSTLTASAYTGSLLWSTGATTSSITVNTAGTYTATQLFSGCTSAAGSGIASPKTTPSTPVVTVVDNCNGTSTLSTTATGTLLWSNNATTPSIIVSLAGTYTVTQSVNGCISAAGSGVAAPKTTPSTPVVTVVDNCNGTSTLSTTATGSLLWNTNETTSSITVPSAGTYTVTQSANGCTSAAGSGVASPKTTPSTPVVTVVDNCNGTSTLSTTATGSLLWNTNETTSSITVPSAGTYTVTQSANGCTSAAGSGVAAPKTTPSTPIVTVVDNCNGTSTLSTTATGSLLWSTNETTSSITVSSTGTYTVTQSVNGCTSAAGSGVASPKTTPSTPVVTVDDNCNGTSTLSTTATGTLLWSNNETTSSITVSSAGTYTVTQAVNGCVSAAGSGVAAPKTTPSTPVVTVVDNCNGTSTLSTTATGSLLWSTNETTSSITVSSTGTYTVTQSVNGCTSAAGSGVASPKTTPSTPVVTVVDNCNGTSTLSTTATGTLLWSNNATTSSITVSSAGTYTVTQTVNGCVSAAGSGVAAPKSAPTPVITVDGPSTVCPGGSIILHATAGTNYTYKWIKDGEVIDGDYGADYEATASGSYSVQIITQGNCAANAVPVTLTIGDTTPPVVPVISDITASCYVAVTAPVAIDACSGAITGIADNAVSFVGIGVWEINWTFTDASGNTSTAVQKITLIDTTAPVVHCPGNISVPASTTDNGHSGAIVSYEATASDNCNANVSYSIEPGSFFPVGTTTVTVTATDNAGNTDVCTFDVTVTCITPTPTITAGGATTFCPGGSVVLKSSSATGNRWSTGATTQSITVNVSGSYSVTVTDATTGCSATSAATVVTVQDVTPPVTPTLSNVIAECSATVTPPTTTDACSGTVTGTTTDALNYHTQGDHIIHWTFTDASGNSTTANQHVIITDVTAPSINCPSNITRSAATTANGYGAYATYAATATDNCGIPTLTYSPVSGSFFPVGTTTVTVTANDGHGYTSTCHFDVTVIAPEINITGNSVTIVDGDATPSLTDNTNFGSTTPGAPIVKTFTIQNTGNDDLNVSAININGIDAANFTLSGFAATVLAPGASTTFTVTFLSNTVGTKNATVTVSNNDFDESSYDFAISADINCSTPVFTACPSSITTNTDAGLCSAVVNYTPTVTGVSAPSLTYTFTGATTGSGAGDGHGKVFNKGVTTVTITAHNACGDAVCSFTITVEDHEKPVIAGIPSNIGKSNNAGICGAAIYWTAPVATDNCPIVTLVSDYHSGDVFQVGTTTVHYTATDASGNTSSKSFDVTVTDDENPTITLPADITHTADAGLCSYKFANTAADINTVTPDGPTPGYGENAILLGSATGTDNCGMPTVVGVRSDGLLLTDPYPVGVTTVTWTVADSHGHTTTGTQNIAITDDEFPVIHNLPANITTGTDANSCAATVTWTAPTSTDNCGVTMVSNHHSGDVFPIGTTTVTYTATDIHGHVTTGSFAVTVADNQLPTIACPQDIIVSAQPGKNGANVTYTVTAGDNCGMPVLTYTIASGSLFGIGSTPVTATATDANGNHVSCTFNVIVNNNPPVANPDVNTTTEDTPVSGNVLPNDTDLDGHSLTVTTFILNSVSYTAGQTATFAEGTLVLNTDGSYTYTPAANFNGAVPVVTYYITDGHGGIAHTILTINVTPVNDGPVANPDTNTTQEDTPVSGNVLPNDTDLDGDNLTVTGFVINGVPYTPGMIALLPVVGDLVINANGTYTYIPAPNYNGPVPIVTYSITDGHGGTASSTLTINVTPVDDAPVAVNDTETVNEDGVLTSTVTGNDTPSGDGGNVWSVVTTTTHGTLVFHADGTYAYTPNANFNGTDVFTYKVCDADGDCSTATVTITVISVDDAPIAVNDTETVNEDGVLTSTVTGNDTPSGDGGNVWSVVTTTTHGTLVFHADGTYAYTPNANFNGTDVFTYKVCDADGDCSTATVTITVISVDDAPIAVNDTETVNEDGVLTSTVTGNDTPSGDGGNTWSVVTTTTHGTLVFNPDGSYTYTPTANYNGPDSFTYKVCDIDGDCSTAIVNITVVPVNDIPLAVNDAVSTNEDVAIHSTVTGNDTPSPDGGNIWSVVTTTTHGTLVFNTDGSYVYTPNANYNGPDSFTYKVCDINGDCATATVNITVIPVNDDPIIKVKNITVYVDAAGHVSITPGQIDDGSSDPDGISSITLNKTNFSCADIATSPNTVTLTVTDVNGNSMSANATVTVLDAIAPTITCPAPVTVQCASSVPAPNTASVIAADNCSYIVSFVGDVISNQTAANKYTITRTYRAVDPSGNSATCTQIITVNDNTAPTLIVAGSLPGNSNGQCLAGVPGAPLTSAIAALYSDNCSGTVTAVLTSTTTTGSNAAGWVRKYFYAVTDASGNTTTACVTYSGKDTQAPVPTVATLPTVTAQCTASVTAPTATDNCVGMITATTSSPLTYSAQGTYTITWTYTDGNGNTSSQTQTVIVKDVTPPAINCPSDITVNANTTVSGQAGANVTFTATATDNCTTPTITYSKAPNSFFPTGTTMVTATADDGNGNTSACTFKVTVNCVTPVFTTCPSNKTVNTDAGLCSAVVAYTSAATGTVTVSCNYTFSGATTGSGTGNGSGKVFNRGITTVTITASNLCGTATCSFTVTVVDTEKPRITAPMAYSVVNDAGICGATLTNIGTPVTGDNCGVASVTNNHPSTYYPVGKTIVTWTVTDVNGNVTDTAKQCITVMDNELPTISVTNISVNNSAGICGANLTLAAPVTSDNCGVASVTNDHASNYYAAGTTTVTWTVTDNAGWTKTTTQTVTVTDTEKPVIVCVPNITIACGLLPLPGNTGVATATDNCGVASITYTDAVNGNITTRTWKAVDAAGNTSTCSQTITVGGPFNASITSVPTSNTYTGGTVNSLFIGYGAQSTVLQSNVPAGIYTYVWSGADAAMLSNTNTANPVFTPTKGGNFTFTVTIKNLLGCTSTASISICVTDIRVFASVPTNNNCTHQAHNSWNCPHSGHGHSCSHGAHNSYSCPDKDDADDHQGMCNHQSHSSSDCPHKGHNHSCDHRSHSSYNCAHRSCNDRDDDDDHQRTCDHKAHSSSDCSHRGHNHATCNHQAHSSANCSHNSNNSNEQKVCNHQSHNSGDCNHSGHNHGSCNHRSHSASDCPHNGGNGGTDDDADDRKVYICHKPSYGSSQTLTVSVNDVAAHLANHTGDRLGSCDQAPCTGYTDNVKPVIDCSDNVTIAYGASTSPAATGSPEADDNSGDVLITYTDASTKGANASSASYYNYVITRTWKAADLAGNFATCAQTITVTETTKPVISCPGSVTVACGSTAPATAGNATATDNSGVVTVTYTDAVSGNKTTRTWKATDPSGNYATCTQTITVSDNVAPVLAAPNDITVNCGASTAPAATGTATATDNCSAVNITYTDATGSNKITRTWKGTDASGNYSTDVQVITIVDLIKPTITAPNDITISCSASTTPSYCGGSATGSDNCSSVSISYSDATAGNKITRTWKATDASGNYSTDVQVITLIDNTKPSIAVPGAITISCGSSTTPSGCGSTATATDNCGTPLVIYSDVTAGNKITRTWTATDAAGNFASGTQMITIVDNTKPVISDVADRTVSCGATDPSTTGTATATDNCSTPVVTYTDAVSGSKITRTWKATDASGNYVISAQVITVTDAVKPVIAAPNDITVNCSNLVTPATTGTATATDNCSTPVITYTDVTSGNKITRTWKATDASGNYVTDAQVITVVDAVKPTIIAPGDITINCSASTTPSYCGGSATGSDNCSSVSITYSDATTGNKITRTWKATDASGNYTTDVQLITIADNTKPVISDVSDITISCSQSTTPSGCNSVATATDNCSTPVVSYSDVTAGNKITRTWKAVDAAGNIATSIQIITIVDNTKPVIADVADKTVNCGASTLPSATGTATATDNCSTPTVIYTDATSGNLITRTWKATDAAGNYSTSVQYITVGSAFTATVTSAPTNSTYTSGINNNLYLGYGAQSTTLTMCSLPSAGAPYTYAWSGSASNKLSSITAASPLFTPTTSGYYTFNVTVTNKFGCTSFAVIAICVTDIRVAGTNGAKVYMCHTPSGKNKTPQTLQVAISQVSSHLNTTSCGSDGNDRLGSCDQTPCNTSAAQSTTIAGNTTGTTKEAAEEVNTSIEELKVTVMPNPSTTFFTLKMESKYEIPISMRVMDGRGRVVDAKTKIGSNSTIQIGHNYSSGTYYAELIQGSQRKVIQLIKARG